jgi:hypothetical protein
MPVRFQVDPDFYDHPKTYGMSDAAVALWTRAGSYSAAKLTDGFIAEHVLALLSQSPQEAADELKRRGLWSRVKGGYKFHQWCERNLTKQRVQTDQKTDRDRKRRDREAARNAAGQMLKPEAVPPFVHSDSNRSPNGFHPESGESPAVSVSVSSSVSVSGSGRGAEDGSGPPGAEPPSRCAEHLHEPKPPNCGPCGDARRDHNQWVIAKAKWEREAPKCAKHQGKFAHNCPLCRADQIGVNDE